MRIEIIRKHSEMIKNSYSSNNSNNKTVLLGGGRVNRKSREEFRAEVVLCMAL